MFAVFQRAKTFYELRCVKFDPERRRQLVQSIYHNIAEDVCHAFSLEYASGLIDVMKEGQRRFVLMLFESDALRSRICSRPGCRSGQWRETGLGLASTTSL